MLPYRQYLLLVFFSAFWGAKLQAQASKEVPPPPTASAVPAPPPVYTIYDSMPQLEERILQSSKATTLVIKFWATWCKPCVEELPMFEQLNERYGNKNVKVLLVSLDFKSQLQKRFLPFLETTRLKSEVVLFADQDANTWIPRINEEWDGAIPATYIIRDGKREFHSGRFKDFNELEAFMTPFLKGLASSSASSRR